MMIKDLFAKPIDRDIKGVIKVGQDDSSNVRQELEEYVVTRELQKHFAEFFASYKRGILGTTDKMGVWISGFFGSGKSHFLKILSYLLANKNVDGKAAIDYFIDDQKIIDNTVLADMRLAANVPTDVVLFNIDSKGEMSSKQSKDAIVSVFLKVFNEMQGFCGSIPFLADLERKLTDDGKYSEFKSRFEDSFGSPWQEARNDFDFIQDDVVEVLAAMGFMSEEAARNWCEKAAEPYSISIERFADLVKKYIDKKGSNHHVVFLVDEIGQYIGEDSRLMLNLQTVTEDLGTACRGKAWIIVTSQQDIDSITKTKGNDFSKIQGRFDTRLSLSSANVDEVIRKRILEKNAPGKETLTLLYVHGGSSPQELIIPLLDVKTEKGRRDTSVAQIALVSLTTKITNLITTLDFVQTEPVSDVVKETAYRLCFISDDNEKISNENIYLADKKDTDTAKRVFRLRFSFKNKKYDKGRKYYLVAFDDKNGLEALRQEIIMDIAFADDFGFGF